MLNHSIHIIFFSGEKIALLNSAWTLDRIIYVQIDIAIKEKGKDLIISKKKKKKKWRLEKIKHKNI